MMDLGGVTDTPLNSQGSIMGINAKKSDKSCRNLYQIYVENVTKCIPIDLQEYIYNDQQWFTNTLMARDSTKLQNISFYWKQKD